jgi:hypothetical protein
MRSSSNKKSIFDNCKLYSPSGELVGRCQLHRCLWYLKNNLAQKINNDPTQIQLTFYPKGKEGLDDPATLADKPNCCVVCGTTTDLTKHHVVPYAIRKYLPDKLKKRCHRDILPCCISCHTQYEQHANIKKQELADRYQIPILGNISQVIEIVKNRHTCKLLFNDKVPEVRKEQLQQKLCERLGCLSKQEILHLANLTDKEIKKIYFGEMLISKITDFNAFILEWREHFVQIMNPKYMPEYW